MDEDICGDELCVDHRAFADAAPASPVPTRKAMNAPGTGRRDLAPKVAELLLFDLG